MACDSGMFRTIMPSHPDLIERATLLPASPLLTLALVQIEVRFRRDVIFAGQTTRTQAAFGRVLRADPDAVFVMMMPLMPRDLHERAMARFTWDAAAKRWTLAERLSAAEMDHPPAPYDAFNLERAALAVRLERHASTAVLADVVAKLGEAVARVPSPPAFALLDLGLGAAVAGRVPLALEMLARAVAAGCAEEATARAVRARLLLEQGDVAGAEAEVAALAALPSPGLNSDGVPLPARWLRLHEAYLRGRCAAARGDDKLAAKVLEGLLKDADACAKETEPHRERAPDGTILSADIGAIVFLESTLDPQIDRRHRGDSARRLLAGIALRRSAWEQVLARLEPLDLPGDEMLRAKALLALGREAEGTVSLERAAAGGVVEAQEMLQERRRRAALESRPKSAAPVAGLDMDDRVEHGKFGTGTVVDVEESGGRVVRVSVAFDDGATRGVPAGAVRKVE